MSNRNSVVWRWAAIVVTVMCVVPLLVRPAPAVAQATIDVDVIGGGGGEAESASFRIHDTLGGGPIGPLVTGQTREYQDGFQVAVFGVASPPVCQVDPVTLDLFVDNVGETDSETFTMTNTGGGVIAGTVVETCDDFDVQPTSFAVFPGDTQVFTVTFTSSGLGIRTCMIGLGGECGNVMCEGRCGNQVVVGPDGDNWGGDGSPGNPFATIGGGLRRARPGDIIVLGPGIYEEDGLRLKSGVKLLGGTAKAGDVIVDARGRGTVFDCRNVENAMLEGLVITGGSRSGIYCDHSTLTVKDCEFVRNSTRTYGGGAITCRYSTVTAENCAFADNRTDYFGGAIYEYESTAALTGCTFTANKAGYDGGALYLKNSAADVVGCDLMKNTADDGGGIYAQKSVLGLNGCVFWANSASGGGGGALYAYRTPVEMTHCTFASNRGDYGAAMCLWTPTRSTFDNVIVAFHKNGPWYKFMGSNSEPVFNCCDVYGNFGGDWVGAVADQDGVEGNLCEDPLFCDMAAGDCHPSQISPCVAVSACGRIGALDVGCPARGPRVVVALSNRPETETIHHFGLSPNVPNPFNPMTGISYTIPSGADPSRVTLIVYNCLGQRVRTLVDREESGGVHAAVWNGTDDNNVPVASGVYFYRLTWDRESETRRMVLLK